MKKPQPGRYLPEWADFEAIAKRESQKRACPPIQTGTLVRTVLRAFLALSEEKQGKELDKAFSAKSGQKKKS